nr:reverse transcriptase domain-containing protein [Tanacetum cinerariifolium]
MTSITSLCELTCQVAQKKLKEERAAKAKYWKLPVCYDDDDQEERSDSLDDNIISGLPPFSAITPDEPVLSIEEPDNSLTKSSSTSLTSLLEETNTFDNSLPEFETFCFDAEEISSGSTTTHPDLSLLEYEVFHDDHVKKISSGSPTTHSDSSLYASFMFDLSINLFPPADRSDSYEFTDELIPFISAPEYDCFRFKFEPNSRDFTKDVVEDISPTKEPQVLTILPTHPTLQLYMKFQPSSESLFAYVVSVSPDTSLHEVSKAWSLSRKVGMCRDESRRVVPKNYDLKGERFLIASRFPTPPLACAFFSLRATVTSSSKLSRDQTSNPTSSTNPTPKGRIRRSSKQNIEKSNFEENPLPPIQMAENQIMAQLLQAPTNGYEDAIVIIEIATTNFELKHGLINLVQNKQFFRHEKEDPHTHLHYFNKITSTMRVSNVPNSTIKLMLFPFSLEGAAWIWLEKEPPQSILTWEDLVSRFINQFFPPSKTTNLGNEITRFQQRFDESFSEAWNRFNDLLRACPRHGFSELHQLDTFYNAFNVNDQHSLNSAVGRNFLDKMPVDCLKIIESKSKVRQTRAKAVVAKVSSNSSTLVVSANVAELKDMVKALLQDKKNQYSAQTSSPTHALIKAVEPNCVTCGGTHAYQSCPATSGNVYQDNIQEYVSQAAAANYGQGNTGFRPQMVANQI